MATCSQFSYVHVCINCPMVESQPPVVQSVAISNYCNSVKPADSVGSKGFWIVPTRARPLKSDPESPFLVSLRSVSRFFSTTSFWKNAFPDGPLDLAVQTCPSSGAGGHIPARRPYGPFAFVACKSLCVSPKANLVVRSSSSPDRVSCTASVRSVECPLSSTFKMGQRVEGSMPRNPP